MADQGTLPPPAEALHACSIVARNYLPQARVLASSWVRHHPDSPLELLVLDDLDGQLDDRDEPFVVVRPEQLDLDDATWQEMAFIYDVMELATAVKPTLLTFLRRRHGGAVAYLDPDIEIFGPLEHVADAARDHPIVLTPHMLEPREDDGRRPTEHDIIGCGVYNLGFICVSEGSERFLEWWAQRLRYHAVVDFRSSLFTDQRWVDFVPGYFDFVALRHPGYNVAYWNLPERTLHQRDGRWFVGDHPLVFFHYSGYEPDRPWAVSKHLGNEPRVLFSERPDVLALCRGYEAQLRSAGLGADGPEYAYNHLPTGARINTRMRRIYRSARLYSASFDEPPPAKPFTEQGAVQVLEWLNSPSALFEGSAPQSRYLESIWRKREDLQLSFPYVHGEDSDEFRLWVRLHGQREEDIPPEMVPVAERPSPFPWADPRALRPGITVAGYLRGELGMGEAARSVLAAVERTGLEHATAVVTRTYSRQDHPLDLAEGPFDLDTAIAVVNADQVRMFEAAVGRGFFKGRKTVGFWSWELEEFPESMVGAADRFDEIWANSSFAAEAVRSRLDRPVQVFPLTVTDPRAATAAEPAAPAGEPVPLAAGRFMFLFVFDYLSVFERKNPLALVDAFTAAFAPDEGPVLVLKSVNGGRRRLDRERLRLAASARPDIVLVEDYMTKSQRDALLSRADAYVSLHRAEGFGLTMAEAMVMGKPVIATAYSGNMDFMSEANSFLVPFTMSRVPEDCDPYPAGAPWADPDPAAAAQLIRQVVEDPDLVATKTAAAVDDVGRSHGLEVATAFVARRFEVLAAMPWGVEEDGAGQNGTSPQGRPGWTRPRRLIGGASRRLSRTLDRLGAIR